MRINGEHVAEHRKNKMLGEAALETGKLRNADIVGMMSKNMHKPENRFIKALLLYTKDYQLTNNDYI